MTIGTNNAVIQIGGRTGSVTDDHHTPNATDTVAETVSTAMPMTFSFRPIR